MTKMYLHMVFRNEVSRYLESSLRWNSRFFDGCHFYDDRSDDDSARVASWFGDVTERGDDVPSFVDNEGKFRHAAMQDFFEVVQPEENDWVFVMDADEYLYPYKPLRRTVESIPGNIDLFRFHVHEIWDLSEKGVSRARIDGFWGDISQVRAFRVNDETRNFCFKSGFGCGSVPFYGKPFRTNSAEIFHFGYAELPDRQSKYARYSGARGHSNKHIESILAPPVLKKIDTNVGHYVWRGLRG